MAIFEDLNISASNLVPDFIKGVNDYTTKGSMPMLGIGLFIVLGITMLISAKKGYSFPKAFAFAAFSLVVLSGIMVKIGFFTSAVFYIAIVLFVIAIVMLIAESNES